jgi:hypothetical protein
VDGISDQSLPAWDGGVSAGYFGRFFSAAWVTGGHIKLARYVVQWNLMSESTDGANPGGDYREKFEAWLTDVGSLGLAPEVALTSFDGIYPEASAEYQTRLQQILNQARAMGHPVRYVEAWNEPNHQGDETALKAAQLTNSADALCEEGYGCTVIAGNLEDSPNVATYEKEYESDLTSVPRIWGVHPYDSVEETSEAPLLSFVENLPHKGLGEQIWFTEIAARVCTDFGNGPVENGEVGQAERAKWLVDTLMRNRKPEHVFYYVFLLGDGRVPSCSSEPEDDALYEPSSDPNAPDAPRAAASYIWDGRAVPLAYTGAASSVHSEQATLTGSLYPAGFSDAKYRFQYSTSTDYGSTTPEGEADSGFGRVAASLTATGLQAGTTYHYRLVATDAEGTTYGADHTLATSCSEPFAFPRSTGGELVTFGWSSTDCVL